MKQYNKARKIYAWTGFITLLVVIPVVIAIIIKLIIKAF